MGAILFRVDDLSDHYESWWSGAVLSWFQGSRVSTTILMQVISYGVINQLKSALRLR